MYTRRILLLTLAALLPAINAGRKVPEGARPYEYANIGTSCETSIASPLTGDLTMAINELKGRGGYCRQSNPKESHCTTLVREATASISVCGNLDGDNDALSCADVANYATELQNDCLWSERVGGTYTISERPRLVKRVEVVRSPYA